MRCKLIVALDVLIYVYATPFLYASSDETSNIGRVSEMCVLGNFRCCHVLPHCGEWNIYALCCPVTKGLILLAQR
jgi:hypothetical protein